MSPSDPLDITPTDTLDFVLASYREIAVRFGLGSRALWPGQCCCRKGEGEAGWMGIRDPEPPG
jgi:hypothetical protein